MMAMLTCVERYEIHIMREGLQADTPKLVLDPPNINLVDLILLDGDFCTVTTTPRRS